MTIAITLLATYHGPNPFSQDPVVVFGVSVAPELANEAPRIAADLAALSAPWFNLRNVPGGEHTGGVQLAGLLVHWSLAAMTFVRGYLHAAGQEEQTVWLGFHDPALSIETMRFGARLIQAVAKGRVSPEGFESAMTPLWDACRTSHPDYQARILMEAARAKDVPYTPAWGLARHWQFGQGARSRVMFETSSVDDGAIGERISASKDVSKVVLAALGLPTPTYVLVQHESELEAAVVKVGFPCVTKPLDLGSGKGVTAGHRTLEDVRLGFREAQSVSKRAVMVEAFIPGDDHRLMVVDGVLRVAIRRNAATICGDGHHTISELVAIKNSTRDARGLVSSGYLRTIPLDTVALRYLAQQGVDVDAVLPAGRIVKLRSVANGAGGGDSTDLTDRVHPQVRAMAETLANTLNVRTFGADYLTTDVSRAPRDVGGAFIEINTTPGLAIVMAAGWSAIDAGRLVLGPSVGRIELDLLLVADTELDAIGQELAQFAWPPDLGWASEAQAMLAGMALEVRPYRPWAGAYTLMAHRGLGRALLLCGISQMMQHGLPADRLSRVYVCGDTVRADWQKVLRQAAKRISVWPDAASAWRAYQAAIAQEPA